MPNYTPPRQRLAELRQAAVGQLDSYGLLRGNIANESTLSSDATVAKNRVQLIAAIRSLIHSVDQIDGAIDALDALNGQTLTMPVLGSGVVTAPVRLNLSADQQTRTLASLRPGLANPDVVPPAVSGRPVVDMSGSFGTLTLSDDNTIYDFGGYGASGSRDVTIRGNNSQVRNLRGTGARRVGDYGYATTDSGFRDFDYTYCQIKMENADITRPYFINGVDTNPNPSVGVGSPIHCYAYQGNIYNPLFQNMLIEGWQLDLSNPDPHNDAIHFTGINGGQVWNPSIVDCTIYSGGSLGVLYRHCYGTVTVTGSTMYQRYGAANAFQLNCDDVPSTVTLLWQNNTLPNNNPPISYSAVAFGGVVMHPSSDATLNSGFIIV